MPPRVEQIGDAALWLGDCRDVLPGLSGVDAVVTDPPYELSFMGRAWDSTGVAFQPETWAAVLRVLKPGGHLVAFGSTRTYHRMACAIEDAGFQIKDSLMWVFGSGFPKHRNALKPAFEPIILARKPLDGTLAGNTLKHGVGGLNIDACRVETDESTRCNHTAKMGYHGGTLAAAYQTGSDAGRWPANLLHDGSDEVLEAFAAFGERSSGKLLPTHNARESANGSMSGKNYAGRIKQEFGGDTGTAARFFYCAKASKADRAGSAHPTVKPLALMRWLVRLITPAGGTVLDPFAGSGTTGEAAMLEGMKTILIEADPQHAADIRHRLTRWSGADTPLFATA